MRLMRGRGGGGVWYCGNVYGRKIAPHCSLQPRILTRFNATNHRKRAYVRQQEGTWQIIYSLEWVGYR